ncbi:hypothetical protein NCLIV_006480 [Neospora caninum Liverpool]|uniref:Uncharacterized protein n=1 Tax=Neospora caninum (strain Liverpool) TaxID=572307 RepID=F0V8Y1_NEOCL|nr:hypothetical protein NCLIV_006480 [Neospora caninum Liverpool]CBZ50172.1 hypothetical protein NCLIV_006480 [Neospora caninum Liverpool]CEL64771.1 TPA: hypothetical protein BN1204_006480 [Neospora caninum Liverpool]|eukprot:XP_003880207.1 hypothetical protein NCLIV_006480 [Neospora caninum Liverpool]
MLWLSVLVAVAAVVAAWRFVVSPYLADSRRDEPEEETRAVSPTAKEKKTRHRHHGQMHSFNQKKKLGGDQEAPAGAKHPLHADVLKGISKFSAAAAVSADGMVAAVAGSDATLHMFDLSGGVAHHGAPQPARPHIVARVQGEALSAVDFLPVSGGKIRIAGALENYRRLVIFELQKTDADKKKTLVETFRGDTPLQRNRVRWLIASKGEWICTASEEDDTEIRVWAPTGELLASVDTKQVQTFQFACSPSDGRFLGCAAWSAGVKLYEIKRKNGLFVKMEKAMDLRTSKGTKCLAVSPDNTRAVSLDKSGELTLWSIDVRYFVSEDPKSLLSLPHALEAPCDAETLENPKDEESVAEAFRTQVSQLAFAADGKILICVAGPHLKFLDVENNFKPIQMIRYAHQRPVETLVVPPCGGFILTAALDSRPQLWLLPTGVSS